jgi:hypothetical protein
MQVVGVRVPKTGHGLPTDTLGKYADTTVSPPVTEAPGRITAPRARARACSHITAAKGYYDLLQKGYCVRRYCARRLQHGRST